jgi:hypothetical protein
MDTVQELDEDWTALAITCLTMPKSLCKLMPKADPILLDKSDKALDRSIVAIYHDLC